MKKKTTKPASSDAPASDESTITIEPAPTPAGRSAGQAGPFRSGGKSFTVAGSTPQRGLRPAGRSAFKAAVGARNGPAGMIGQPPNIIAPGVPPTETGSETVGVANADLRALAQRCIVEVREHRHLQDARVLLLVVEKPSTAKGLQDGKRGSIGKAAKARSLDRLLSSVKIVAERPAGGEANAPPTRHEHADFVVRLSGDYLEAIGWPDEEGAKKAATALIDHELCHCGAKIAGEFVKPGELAARVEGLGDDHVETCDDVKRDGDVLVRYYWRSEGGAYGWIVRKHDVEEFNGVMERHGAWARQLRRMVDVLVERGDMPLFRHAGEDEPQSHRPTVRSGQRPRGGAAEGDADEGEAAS